MHHLFAWPICSTLLMIEFYFSWKCWHGQDPGLEDPVQDLPEPEEEAGLLRPEPEGCHQRRALWHHQPGN